MNTGWIVVCSLALSFAAAVGVNLQKLSMAREAQKQGRQNEEDPNEKDELDASDIEDLDRNHNGNANGIIDEQNDLKKGGQNDQNKEQASINNFQISNSNTNASEWQQSSQEASKRNERPPYLQPLWCLGMAIIIADACADFVFIGVAPQSLLAPLGNFALVWNMILAPIFHTNEIVTKPILLATVIIYVGTILTIVFAADGSSSYLSLAEIKRFWKSPTFIVYEVLCFFFLLALGLCGSTRGKTFLERATGWTHFFSGKPFGIIRYCGIAGCLGGQCILFAKSTSELIQNALATQNLGDWTSSALPYLLIVAMILTVFTQIHFLNKGLANFDALLVVPIYQSIWNVFGVSGGLIFFQEYSGMSVRDVVLYMVGICITLSGVAILVYQRHLASKDIPNKDGSIDVEGLSDEDGGFVQDAIVSQGQTSEHTIC